jgi:5-methyltetrahydrofolate--homocysteine methyltransferase
MTDLKRLAEAMIDGDISTVESLTRAILSGGTAPGTILEALQSGMSTVGERMADGTMFIPEVLRCAKAMQGAVDLLRPYLEKEGMPSAGTVLIGTVKGDIHDIGKKIVAMMLEANGFTVKDLGIDVPPEAFVEAVRDDKPDLVALSALLSTTRGAMKDTIGELEKAGLRAALKILIGGTPVTQHYADEIGADGYAAEAGMAVIKAKELVG